MGVLYIIVVLSSFLCCIIASGAHHIPTNHRHRHSARTREREVPPQATRKNDENRAYVVLNSLKARHYREHHRGHQNDAVFAADLFQLFDMNNDGIIELNEFFTTLQFLGVIQIDPDYMS